MSKFLNERYKSLDAYTPGEQPQDKQYIKLNTNESPYPPSDGVIAAVNAAEVADLRLYSDPECRKLREALAELHGVNLENIFVSNGSDDILNFAFMAFGGDGAVFPEITYGFYKVFAELHGVNYETVPLSEDFSVRVEDYLGTGRFTVLANPNAPTGRYLPVDEIERIVAGEPDHVVVIDEAYIDFGGESCYTLINKYPNLLVVQTFSKSRSMAGARLGFAIADKGLIDDLGRIKYSTNPYSINRLTLAAGTAAVKDNQYYMENCRRIIETRAFTTEALEALGFHVLPSKANFVFAESAKIDGGTLYRELKARGILVRHFDSEKIRNFNRITIGSRKEMEALIATVEKILEERP